MSGETKYMNIHKIVPNLKSIYTEQKKKHKIVNDPILQKSTVGRWEI